MSPRGGVVLRSVRCLPCEAKCSASRRAKRAAPAATLDEATTSRIRAHRICRPHARRERSNSVRICAAMPPMPASEVVAKLRAVIQTYSASGTDKSLDSRNQRCLLPKMMCSHQVNAQGRASPFTLPCHLPHVNGVQTRCSLPVVDRAASAKL